MELGIYGRAYKYVRPRLLGLLLVSVFCCAPVYALAWLFSLIDDPYARILISLLVTILPVSELSSEPRPLRSRWDVIQFALFVLPALAFATAHKLNLRLLASNTAILVAVLPYCWLLWLLMGRSLMLLSGLIIALGVMMVYWVVALVQVGGPLEILLLPLPAVLFGGGVWALPARWVFAFARRRKYDPRGGPGMQALAMVVFFLPVILVAVIVPSLLELRPIWSAVSLTVVGVLLSAVVSEPLRRFLLEWGNLTPNPINSGEGQSDTHREN